jgi:hypothetical protein
MDGALAARVAREAADALRANGDDTAPAVQLVRAEPELRRHLDIADRLGLLGATAPNAVEDVAPWLDEVDAVVAARSGEIPPALRDDIDRLRARGRAYLAGRPPDDKPVGYERHPDYAEVGRLGQQLRLADRLTARPIETAPAALSDSLPW